MGKYYIKLSRVHMVAIDMLIKIDALFEKIAMKLF